MQFRWQHHLHLLTLLNNSYHVLLPLADSLVWLNYQCNIPLAWSWVGCFPWVIAFKHYFYCNTYLRPSQNSTRLSKWKKATAWCRHHYSNSWDRKCFQFTICPAYSERIHIFLEEWDKRKRTFLLTKINCYFKFDFNSMHNIFDFRKLEKRFRKMAEDFTVHFLLYVDNQLLDTANN